MLTKLPSGTILAFEYQAPEGHWEPRIGVLWSIRDLHEKPLETKTVTEKPDLVRSRYLLRLWDFAQRDYRHFYNCRIRNWEVTDLTPFLMIAKARMASAA